jgi:hypothetical protein
MKSRFITDTIIVRSGQDVHAVVMAAPRSPALKSHKRVSGSDLYVDGTNYAAVPVITVELRIANF